RLCELLDTAGRGWRKLAEVAGAEKRFKCSEEELEMCSLKVLEPRGSPTQCLLQLLAERDCTLKYLLGCLDRMGHARACQVLSGAGRDGQRGAPGAGGGRRGQPRPCRLAEGDTLVLECRALGSPPPQYQWFRNRRPVEGARTARLQVPLVTTAERGSYSCRVFNLFHEVWSQEVDVEIGESPVWGGATPTPPVPHPAALEGWRGQQRPSPVPAATDKVALLMGNMRYLHHKHLKAPMVDVHALSSLLCQLDFKVVSLLDLRRDEMQMAVDEFLLLLDKGVYGLLYYAGHGYENFGNSFMVPIDAPGSYTSAHCLCVQRVLQSMQQRHTGLNIFLLDMCRKRNPNDDVIPQVGALQVTANIVFGYATCADADAYELSQDELSNGIFVSFLKRWLLQDEKITVLLDKVAEDMGTLEITRGRQALELRSNLSERRALTDPIRPSGQDETSARNLQWAKAHVLPESRHLHFDCGVAVQLGFAAEFSNIMIIYTRVLAAPGDVAECVAKLTDIPEELDADLKCTNRESPEELGSPLSPTWSPACP
ncbi:MALT1 protein, partial [Alectura lathami]|nr:MALT1 protein [Alectura lathami]